MYLTLKQIKQALSELDGWSVSVEKDCLLIKNTEEIEAFLTICGEQIIVESLLVPVEQVKNTAEFNKEILKTHKMFPMTAISIVKIESVEYYSAFGALSSQSKISSVLLEVEFLFSNVVKMFDIYKNFI